MQNICIYLSKELGLKICLLRTFPFKIALVLKELFKSQLVVRSHQFLLFNCHYKSISWLLNTFF